MNLMFRTMLTFVLARFRRRVALYGVGRRRMRVLPTDLDLLRHMNNGVYLSLADIGRFDLLIRNGVWRLFRRRGWYPVVASETITFRRSLNPWQKFTIESRILGFDAKSVFLEQRFVVAGEICAQMFVKGRILRRTGGSVPIDELMDALGHPADEPGVPEWVASWAADATLPAARGSAPSTWPQL